jgi:hypothetical protein
MAALLVTWKERCVLHVERVESALCKQGCILFVGRRLESIAEEIEGDIRVESGGTGNPAETLVWQPSPASAVVRESEVRDPAGPTAQLSGEARRVSSEINQGDGMAAFGHNNMFGSESLQWVVQPYRLVRHQFRENVSGEDLCEGTEPQKRVLGRSLMRVGRRLAVPMEKNLIVANDYKNHTRGARLKEEIGAESIDGLQVRERCLWRRLSAGQHSGQHEEDKQFSQESRVAHL